VPLRGGRDLNYLMTGYTLSLKNESND
jgi:hypothetical protein